jgi:selenide,water dikinase
MQIETPVVRDIVLVGGGHSHVQVIKRFAMDPLPGARVTLVANELQSPYSGMLPGCIAGVYSEEEIHFNLERLCQFAGARFIHAPVEGLDLEANLAQLSGRPPLRYDLLSINTGAQPVAPYPTAITVKPIGKFLPEWRRVRQQLNPGDTLSVVGAGAGGVELVLAIRAALREIKIVLIGAELMPGHNPKAKSLVARSLADRHIEWVESRVDGYDSEGLTLQTGERLPTDHVLWVTDVRAAPWFAESGLATDADGFIRVGKELLSVSHANVFAAGDAAHLVGQARPKSGVYAVRQGPVLAHNLRQAVQRLPLRKYRAQKQQLGLLGCGDETAIATRGNWAAKGPYWWKLKQLIDKRFMRKFNDLDFMPDPGFRLPAAFAGEIAQEAMRCGGCGAKLAADPLRRVLQRLSIKPSGNILLGIGDDAALVRNNGVGTLLTVDGFRAMISDPYLFGRIAAHHSLNDIFAMGADPIAALALVTVPLMGEALMEEDLYQMLSGVTDVLAMHDVVLAGGHSAEGAELSIGLTVTGNASATTLTKADARVGDQLIVTKPLGTGVVLAAAMRGRTDVSSMAAAMRAMDQSNAEAVEILRRHQVHALTDVTGFGLVGHLGEMLRASGCGAVLHAERVPLLDGVLELIQQVRSSLQNANELALHDFELRGRAPIDPRVRALADPQTSGGMLAAVPKDSADACVAACNAAGYVAAIVGEITAADQWLID